MLDIGGIPVDKEKRSLIGFGCGHCISGKLNLLSEMQVAATAR